MKKTIRIAVFVMLFFACMTRNSWVSYAEPETEPAAEDGTEETADNRLSSLEIAQAILNPDFDPEQLTYTAVVSHDVTRIALLADTSSPEAKKVINGTSDLQVGENIVTITVTGADGSVREYRVTVTREAEPGEPAGPEEPGENVPEPGEPDTEPGEIGTQPGEEEPGGFETQSGGADSPGQTFPAGTQEPDASESNGNASPMEVATGAPKKSSSGILNLSGGKMIILVLAIICLLLVFAIVALLLLRRGTDTEDDGEYEDGPYEDEDDYDDLDDLDDGDDVPDDSYGEPDDAMEAGGGADTHSRSEAKKAEAADAGMVTPEELARFYRILNPEETDSPEDVSESAAALESETAGEEPEPSDWPEEAADGEEPELLDLDEDNDFLEDDDDFDFLDF